MKRCTGEGPTGSGMSPPPTYDPKYVAQPNLGPGARQVEAQSIDPDKATVPIADPASVGGPLSPFARDVLAAHNAARAGVGSPPLKWNPTLVSHAEARAKEMARVGQFTHAPREGRGTERENISMAPLNYTAAQLVGRWVSEGRNFVPGIFPNVCKAGGDCSGVWHWTQMVWEQTTDIGCGMAVGAAAAWLVCRYNPGGNKDGKWVGIPQTKVLADLDTKVEQPKLPGTEVFNSNRASPAVAQAQQPKIGPEYGEHEMIGRTASLFDLGIYAGGAYTTDWFELPDDLDEPRMDWGVDLDTVSKYIWRGFVLNDNVSLQPNMWASAYGFLPSLWMEIGHDAYNSDFPLDWHYDDALADEPADTKVEQPQLPQKEVFKPDPTDKLDDPL